MHLNHQHIRYLQECKQLSLSFANSVRKEIRCQPFIIKGYQVRTFHQVSGYIYFLFSSLLISGERENLEENPNLVPVKLLFLFDTQKMASKRSPF